jgi:hypothetical protein
MAKLRIDNVEDDKPVTLTVKLSAAIHRDLVDYAEPSSAQEVRSPIRRHSLRRC